MVRPWVVLQKTGAKVRRMKRPGLFAIIIANWIQWQQPPFGGILVDTVAGIPSSRGKREILLREKSRRNFRSGKSGKMCVFMVAPINNSKIGIFEKKSLSTWGLLPINIENIFKNVDFSLWGKKCIRVVSQIALICGF